MPKPDQMWRELRRLRLLLGVTQEHMSRVMKIRRATISDWEAGLHHPTPERAQEYADILGVKIRWD